MARRPNVLWLMSDQHNANCMGCMDHPNVKTPHLDRIANRGVKFTNAFANNPICSPSRISFLTGQYVHTHGMFGNDHADWPHSEPNSIAVQFRRFGYQTGLFGKAHMVRKWDEEGFERIRYTDLCDATSSDPLSNHYFKYLVDHGLGDLYEEGSEKPGQEYTLDGSAPAALPYEHSIEHFTGNETVKFLEERDDNRPFFIHMSFQRPHGPIAPAAEYFDMYNPDDIVLPESACDYFDNGFEGKPEFMRRHLEGGSKYPLADQDKNRLKRCLASYYALITAIDGEIGRVLDLLEAQGELENTIVFYTADHGDFAGEHGLFHKNLGLYDSIVKIPFLLAWPGGPRGSHCTEIVESVDFYPSLCELCGIPLPDHRDGESVIPLAEGGSGKDAAFCEWGNGGKINHKQSSIRTKDFRLTFYGGDDGGELYDHRVDSGEIHNLWDDGEFADIRRDLTERLFLFTLGYKPTTGDRRCDNPYICHPHSPTGLIHKGSRYWSQLQNAYNEPVTWPPR